MTEQYLPLYRKYRPQQFSDLVGQDNLVKAFTNAINTGKIAHAYLFCGPRGTGKTSSARILAKSLNCATGPTLTPCGKCPSCLDILNNNMLDVIEMDAASNRSVEDAQNIIDKIHYAPINGKYKIFIIDEVHMISKTAFNALLKTLEEPPENVVFILATTEPQKVLETIISRCQRFDFKRITVDDIVKRLRYISDKENIKITDDALFTIAKNSQGGMRDALALLDQISVLDMQNEITAEKVNEITGKIDTNTLMELSSYIFAKSVENAIQLVNKIYSKGNEPLQIIENVIQHLRNLSIVKSCSDTKTIETLTLLSTDTVSKMKEQLKDITVSEIAAIIDKLTNYHKEIKFTNNRYLWLELCFIDVASLSAASQISNMVVPKEPIKIMQEVSKPKEPTKVDKPAEIKVETITEHQSPTTNTVKPEEKDMAEVNEPLLQPHQQKPKTDTDIWKAITGMIESPPARSFFTTFAKPVTISDTNITITFKDEGFQTRAKEQPKYDALKKACMKYFDVTAIELNITVGDVTPKKAEPTAKTPVTNTVTQNKEIPQKNEEEEIEIPHIASSDKNENENLTEQARMVKDLFDAKVFND